MFDNYAKNFTKSIHEAKHEGKGLKIVTPNQMLKRMKQSMKEKDLKY